MTGRGLLAAMALSGALMACDQTVDLVGDVTSKGESNVPEAARSDLSPETIESLRLRAQGQSFN